MLTRLLLTLTLIFTLSPRLALATEDGATRLNRTLLKNLLQGFATPTPEKPAPNRIELKGAGDELPPMEVHFTKLVNYDSEALQKAENVRRVMEGVLNSPELRAKILNFTYNGQKQFVQNNGQTNEQIYQTIRQGKELAYPGQEYAVDLENEIYWPRWRKWSVVGYTYPDSARIWSNGNYFYSMTVNELAAHFVHEWLHKIGYDHDFKSTARRPYSVPYAVGDLVEVIADQLYPEFSK